MQPLFHPSPTLILSQTSSNPLPPSPILSHPMHTIWFLVVLGPVAKWVSGVSAVNNVGAHYQARHLPAQMSLEV